MEDGHVLPQLCLQVRPLVDAISAFHVERGNIGLQCGNLPRHRGKLLAVGGHPVGVGGRIECLLLVNQPELGVLHGVAAAADVGDLPLQRIEFPGAARGDLSQGVLQSADRIDARHVQVRGLHFGEGAVEIAVFQPLDDHGLGRVARCNHVAELDPLDGLRLGLRIKALVGRAEGEVCAIPAFAHAAHPPAQGDAAVGKLQFLQP